MKTIAEVEVLECKVRGLENENHRLRHHLTDEFAGAAITGLLAYGWGPDDLVVDRAWKIARLMLEKR